MRKDKPPSSFQRPTPAKLQELRERQKQRAKKKLGKDTLRMISRMTNARRAEAKRTPWEDEFLTDVSGRLAVYGSAFADPEKGILGRPLSFRQNRKLKEIERKTRKIDKAVDVSQHGDKNSCEEVDATEKSVI